MGVRVEKFVRNGRNGETGVGEDLCVNYVKCANIIALG